jgi:hypothetical protein
MFETNIKILLEPQFDQEPPRICWSMDGIRHDLELSSAFTIDINQQLDAGSHMIEIEFYNKSAKDSQYCVDKAVIIKSVVVEGLSTTKLSQGNYYPEFPEPWASEQQAQGIDLFETYRTSTYLGWNGRWVFEFTCPIYQWIHRTENLGFSYV